MPYIRRLLLILCNRPVVHEAVRLEGIQEAVDLLLIVVRVGAVGLDKDVERTPRAQRALQAQVPQRYVHRRVVHEFKRRQDFSKRGLCSLV